MLTFKMKDKQSYLSSIPALSEILKFISVIVTCRRFELYLTLLRSKISNLIMAALMRIVVRLMAKFHNESQ